MLKHVSSNFYKGDIKVKILVINAGSSSLKYQLIDMDNEKVIAKGNCERIGIDGIFGYKTADGKEIKKDVPMPDHRAAFMQVKDALTDSEAGVIKDLAEVSAIGHRIVQGGALFSESVIVDEEVIKGIESLIPLAPLHNKGHVQAIRACVEVFGENVPQVVVFDTAFHSTMPEKAYIYPIPYEYYEKYQIRRYGFHGTSHRYVSKRCAELMGKDIKDLKLITCHIGNGSSITAIDGGKVIDTSMGLTPLDGFMMGSRTGTLDPSVVTFIAEKENLSPSQMSDLLNKKSGLLGVSGVSTDDRDVTKAAREGNKRAQLAHLDCDGIRKVCDIEDHDALFISDIPLVVSRDLAVDNNFSHLANKVNKLHDFIIKVSTKDDIRVIGSLVASSEVSASSCPFSF